MLTGQMQGTQNGPTYTEGDTVGAGIHLHRKEIFFTKNSQYLGVASLLDSQSILNLVPTIGLHSKNEQAEVNFGEKPFKFDLDGMIDEELRLEQEQYEKQQIQSKDLHTIVRDYLLYNGYKETLDKFDDAWKFEQNSPRNNDSDNNNDNSESAWLESLTYRSQIRKLILDDEVDKAIEVLRDRANIDFAAISEQSNTNYNDLEFVLHAKKFLEICTRQCQSDNGMAALKYAQQYLSKFQTMEDVPSERIKLLQDCMTLLMFYPQVPEWLAYLLSVSQKEVIADVVNKVLLITDGEKLPHLQVQQPVIQRLLQYLVVVQAKLIENNGNQGEIFQLHDFMKQHCSHTYTGEANVKKELDTSGAISAKNDILQTKKFQ
eukprot:TRINITY_DN8434_c1_g1_i5.p1 TRINITY_DN8434_c1_g1~~TRINITY_DN8434_c1_g1_i5.p1  ORF type:complete len:423 (+),score=53.02 TRINITY_DN8434_c1_g1_i5:146-1270(+)